MKRWRAAIGAALCFIASPAEAGDTALASAVKATYLVKFAHYVAWPATAMESPTAPIRLCIVGRDPFGAAVDGVAQGELIDQHPVVVRRIAMIDRAAGCNIAFLAGDVAGQALLRIEGSPILSVTDAAETRARGMLQFEVRGGHVGFHVDDIAAARAGLRINSRLLSIALSIKSREAGR